MSKPLLMTLASMDAGEACRRFRQSRNLSRQKFAEILRVRPTVIQRGERGYLVAKEFYEALVWLEIIPALPPNYQPKEA